MDAHHSDKGWLRQWLPNPTPDQLHDFIERVGIILDGDSGDLGRVEMARRAALESIVNG